MSATCSEALITAMQCYHIDPMATAWLKHCLATRARHSTAVSSNVITSGQLYLRESHATKRRRVQHAHRRTLRTSSSRRGAVKTAAGPTAAPLELFSVAPMMAHTHRHHRFFFRLISEHAWLYTEMLPAAQCQSPETEALIYHPSEHPVALQLGGHDIEQLASATRIATSLGYDAVNLNCGCPSPNVTNGARRGGAAMMREPEHVAACVAAMQEVAISEAAAVGARVPPIITVKHRLSVVDDTPTAPYDAEQDRISGPTSGLCTFLTSELQPAMQNSETPNYLTPSYSHSVTCLQIPSVRGEELYFTWDIPQKSERHTVRFLWLTGSPLKFLRLPSRPRLSPELCGDCSCHWSFTLPSSCQKRNT